MFKGQQQDRVLQESLKLAGLAVSRYCRVLKKRSRRNRNNSHLQNELLIRDGVKLNGCIQVQFDELILHQRELWWSEYTFIVVDVLCFGFISTWNRTKITSALINGKARSSFQLYALDTVNNTTRNLILRNEKTFLETGGVSLASF